MGEGNPWRGFHDIVPIAIGAVAFFLTVGVKALSQASNTWLLVHGDPAQHYMGWLYYLNSPWTLPLGANPAFGLEISSSILYSDSIPLMALVFKAAAPILPNNFQYFGLWLLLCFVLQSWFAWKLVSTFVPNVVGRAFAAAFFAFSPPMLSRLFFHHALAAHWIILAALYLCLSKDVKGRLWKWTLLVGTASLIHTYLLAMVALLWLADWCKSAVSGATVRSLAVEVVSVCCVALVTLWQLGLFMIKSKVALEYGVYRMNANALINPGFGTPPSTIWSFVLPSWNGGPYEYEGFNYLGLGLIGVVIAIIPYAARRLRSLRPSRTAIPLVCASIGLTLFAMSHHVSVGSQVFVVDIPDFASRIGGQFRASGRMFWPVYYLIVLGILMSLFRAYRPFVASCLAGALLVLQVADTSRGWTASREAVLGKDVRVESPLTAPEWGRLASSYARIRMFPPGRSSPRNQDVAHLALMHGKPTDAVYLARDDTDKLYALIDRTARALSQGRCETDTLYVIDPSFMDPGARNLLCRDAMQGGNLFRFLDGLCVLAPGWENKGEGSSAGGATATE